MPNASGGQIPSHSSLAANIGLPAAANQRGGGGGGGGGHMIPGAGHMITAAGASSMMGSRGFKPGVGDYHSPSR